jgi:hypothetical protein
MNSSENDWLVKAMLSLEQAYWQAWREHEERHDPESRRQLTDTQRDLEALQDWAARAARDDRDAVVRLDLLRRRLGVAA